MSPHFSLMCIYFAKTLKINHVHSPTVRCIITNLKNSIKKILKNKVFISVTQITVKYGIPVKSQIADVKFSCQKKKQIVYSPMLLMLNFTIYFTIEILKKIC